MEGGCVPRICCSSENDVEAAITKEMYEIFHAKDDIILVCFKSSGDEARANVLTG